MKVIVLGAGVIGTATAWYLLKAGHEVTVFDRQSGAGLETSYRNGGQISVSHAVPWANPHAPGMVMSWLSRPDSPLSFHFGFDQRLPWIARFLYECLPSRTLENIRQIINLATYSRQKLIELRLETGIDADFVDRGILHIYSSPRMFDRAAKEARLMQDFGVNRQIKNVAECLTIEPALKAFRNHIIGGTYTNDDFSGDAHKFTQSLASKCEQIGAQFQYKTNILKLIPEGNHIAGVLCSNETGKNETCIADAYVAALGSYTPILLKPLGIRLPIIPAGGYSASIPVRETHDAPITSLINDEFKLVFSRYPKTLRIAGMVDINGYGTVLDKDRCNTLLKRAQQMFPNGGDYEHAEFWKGLRPSEPGNTPSHLGFTNYTNLFNNSGHGTLGWTMACGSGQAIADLVSGKRPEPDFRFACGSASYTALKKRCQAKVA
ncbi:MAG: D-amino acid dehydrogenase [Pseudomonadota bacterium]|nr:D-amino acid dehydrogenase [Pseudomonadota bacterium]